MHGSPSGVQDPPFSDSMAAAGSIWESRINWPPRVAVFLFFSILLLPPRSKGDYAESTLSERLHVGGDNAH